MSYPNLILSLRIKVNKFCDVVMGLICSNYNIFVDNIATLGCSFCAHWPSAFFISNLNKRPNSFDPIWKGTNLLFFSFCPFSGIVLHRVHKKFEVVFPIYGLWLTIFRTFSKDFTIIPIVYDALIPRNDMASGTIFKWRIVVRQVGRFSFEISNAQVLQYMYIIKD